MRISKALGLRWSDVDWARLLINIRRAWKYGRLGEPKSKASKAPVQMHEVLAAILQAWRQETAYEKDEDFIFASAKAHGSQPRWHDRARLPAGSCSQTGYHRKRLPEIWISQFSAFSRDVFCRRRNRSGSSTENVATIELGYDDDLHPQRQESKRGAGTVHESLHAIGSELGSDQERDERK